MNTIHLPVIVYLTLLRTFITHLGIYLLLSIIQTAFLWGLAQHHLNTLALERCHITIWCVSVVAILSLNAYFFPLSHFSQLLLPELPQRLLSTILLISLSLLSLFLLNALFFFAKKYPKKTAGLAMIGGVFLLHDTTQPTSHPLKNQAPNIIVIGIDSLSPHKITRTQMPTVARFTQNSVFFKETISPLANTYPAWASILTGLYPEHNQARYNLMPPELVNSSQSIVWRLRQQGYQTLFATDDRQFNMLGKEFGFQTIIGPKGGAADFLIGALNDFPLSNLLVNLSIGRWLFPYNYSNRASYITYYPQTFDKQIQKSLATLNPRSPSFISIHFTLPHWPYIWAESSPTKTTPPQLVKLSEQRHLSALRRVDSQVAQLIWALKQKGYLDKAMLILLSDHGEGFYVQGSRQTNPLYYQGPGTSLFSDYLKKNTSTELEMSGGHGSDLLSFDQYHCLLAFQRYQHGNLVTVPKIISSRVSLLDIAPTLLSYAKSPPMPTDGLSLFPVIISNPVQIPERAFVMESGMVPNQALTRDQLQFLAKKFFTINPQNGHLYVRQDQLNTLDSAKLYGVIQGDWMVALYPDRKGYLPITLHLTSGQWTDELETHFAKTSPAIHLLSHINLFYGKKWALSEPQKVL